MGKGTGEKQEVKATEVHGIHQPVFIKSITLFNESTQIKSCKKKGVGTGVGRGGVHPSNQTRLCFLMGFFQGTCINQSPPTEGAPGDETRVPGQTEMKHEHHQSTAQPPKQVTANRDLGSIRSRPRISPAGHKYDLSIFSIFMWS